jgi:hypothetical protein
MEAAMPFDAPVTMAILPELAIGFHDVAFVLANAFTEFSFWFELNWHHAATASVERVHIRFARHTDAVITRQVSGRFAVRTLWAERIRIMKSECVNCTAASSNRSERSERRSARHAA